MKNLDLNNVQPSDFVRYLPKLQQYAFALSKKFKNHNPKQTAEDIVNDVYIKFYKRCAAVNNKWESEKWLFNELKLIIYQIHLKYYYGTGKSTQHNMFHKPVGDAYDFGNYKYNGLDTDIEQFKPVSKQTNLYDKRMLYKAGLVPKEIYSIKRKVMGYTEVETAKNMGVTKQRVHQHIESGKKKLKVVFS